MEKIDVFLRGQKTPPWKKVRENLRKNGKRGKNTKIVLKSSTFAKNDTHRLMGVIFLLNQDLNLRRSER